MARAIDADDAILQIERREKKLVGDLFISVDAMKEFIKNRPTIEPKQGWISVRDRLPEVEEVRYNMKFSKTVIAWTGKRVVFGYFIYYKYVDEADFDGYDEKEGVFKNWAVDYWMPLPEPPEKE